MRKLLNLATLFLALTATAAPAFAGEVIDGLIATVNHKPIFQSDWEEAIALEAFMQQKPPAQVSQADRVGALRRLIDRHLLQGQMADVSYMLPSKIEVQDSIAKLREQIPGAADDRNWQQVLASHGLTERMLTEHLKSQMQVMSFVEVRLRPNVRVHADEIEAYYKDNLLPELQRAGGKIVTLNEAEPKIRELLTQQHMDEMLEAWLHNLRQQSEIQSTVPIANAPALAASGM